MLVEKPHESANEIPLWYTYNFFIPVINVMRMMFKRVLFNVTHWSIFFSRIYVPSNVKSFLEEQIFLL